MNMLECMNMTIAYIEEHLLEELHMPIIAKAAGCSERDVQQVFYALTGISVAEYVRRRRLSLAGYELQKGKQSVLDVALKYGYTSPDSFTRAFRQLHGITPSEVKKGGRLLKILWKNHLRINDQRSQCHELQNRGKRGDAHYWFQEMVLHRKQ